LPIIKYFTTKHIQYDRLYRTTVQYLFLLLTLWIGYEFTSFVNFLESQGGTVFTERPPGVEAFLPISALISLKHWILSGEINSVHPSGLVIFITILMLALLLKKSFCSWICPIGLLSEHTWKLGKKVFKRNFSLPAWLDYPLRSLKYLILLFFLYAILYAMDAKQIEAFIFSPYNKVADIKMFYFFLNITTFSISVIVVLLALSFLIKNFWCRYLCPYGGLLGALSLISPLKITRTISSCAECAKCTQVCPNSIQVHRARRVLSDECTSCGECVAVCPTPKTLGFKLSPSSHAIPLWLMAILVTSTFILGTSLGRLTGNWQNSVPTKEYLHRILEINSPIYNHTGKEQQRSTR
jgi:polyferredoxin